MKKQTKMQWKMSKYIFNQAKGSIHIGSITPGKHSKTLGPKLVGELNDGPEEAPGMLTRMTRQPGARRWENTA